MRFILALLLFPLVLSSCIAVSSLQRENPVGKLHKDSIQLGNKTIPLPPGDWKVIASGTKRSFYITYLVKEFGDNNFSFIKITVDGPPDGDNFYTGYTASKNLERENMHYVVKKRNIAGERQDGWYINNIIPYFGVKKKLPVRSEAAKYIRDNRLIVGNNYIKVTHRLTGEVSKDSFLEVEYCFSPLEENFDALPVTDWGDSDWNVMRIMKDPKKEAFIEKLKKEHLIIHEKIKASFDK